MNADRWSLAILTHQGKLKLLIKDGVLEMAKGQEMNKQTNETAFNGL
jgi:hypothetical protein